MVIAIAALWRREIIKFIRDRSRVFGALVQPLGFWLLLGLGFRKTFHMPLPQSANVGYMEFLFPGIIVLILLFTAIFSTISIVEERKTGFLQATLVAPTSRTALVLGNTLGGTTLAVAEASLFLLLVPFVGVYPSVWGVLIALAVGLMTGLTFTSLGVIIAWRMESTRGFHAVMNLFLLPMWFLSGSFFPPEGAPSLFRLVIRLNPVTYAVSAIREALYLPGEAPLPGPSLSTCVIVTALSAVVLLSIAVFTVSRTEVSV